MKAFLVAIIAVIALSIGANYALTEIVDGSSAATYSTDSARVGCAGISRRDPGADEASCE